MELNLALDYYFHIFNEIKKSKFLKIQAVVLFITTYIDWTLVPFVTKLEGTYLPVYMISFYMLIGALDGFIQPLFQNTKIYNIYLFTIILDVIQIVSYFMFEYSILIFTYLILTIFTIQGITFEIARIHTVDFMQDEDIELKDYLIIRSLMISGAIVLGSLTAMIFDYFTQNLATLLLFLATIGVYAIYLEIKLYQKFKKMIYSEKVEIQKDKRELFEKFRI